MTPLTLQKLLYFIQGVHSALFGKPIFAEDCRAWIHGPVYPEVYELFRDFKYNPIDDARFALLEGTEDALTKDEQRVIDLVLDIFGMYGGKVLEKITHNEDPWREARKGYGDSIPSSEILPKERIMKYYIAVNQKYGIDTENGLWAYSRYACQGILNLIYLPDREKELAGARKLICTILYVYQTLICTSAAFSFSLESIFYE